MAPRNEYLMDEHIQKQLSSHDPRLIRGSTTWFPGEEPEVHWDFHRPKEFELLAAFLGGYTDLDYRDGKVTAEDAARAVYGIVDEYLIGRVTTTHLHPASGFNKTCMNGQVAVVADDGNHIIRDDRIRVATQRYQAAADKFQHRVAKTATAAGRSLQAEQKRSLRIAPAVGEHLKEITQHAWESTSTQTRLALGQGE